MGEKEESESMKHVVKSLITFNYHSDNMMPLEAYFFINTLHEPARQYIELII